MSYQPTSRDNLLGALNLWYQKANDPNDADALNTANNYVGSGNGSDYNSSPNTWDVTLVTQMWGLFRDITNIGTYTVHPEINGWDVSNVTTMFSMFNGATHFNQPIGNWNVSSVENMSYMFFEASLFNQPIGNWNVSSVTNMLAMFENASAFNQDISGWERTGSTLGNVENMSFMFFEASLFNQPIGNWNVSSVTNMKSMLNKASAFNQNISGWERTGSTLGNVEDMSYIFNEASLFNQPIGNWNVSSVTNMEGMFQKASAFNEDISGWERTGSTLGNVENMSFMFFEASLFNQPIGNWNVSSVTNMKSMLNKASAFNQNISGWERTGSTLGNVEDMSYMFYQAFAFNQPIGNWNVSSVTNMKAMFQYATTFNQDISGWERTGSTLGNVENMEGMFLKAMMFNNGDTVGSSTKSLNIWNVSSVQNMSYMFNQAFSFNQPIGDWNISSVTTMYGMFFAASLFNQDISSWTIPSNLIDMTFMFEMANSFNQDISLWNVEHVTKMRGMFTNAYQFNQNIGGWTVNKVDDMREMFSAGITFQRPFGNVVRDIQTIYKNPLGSESWGGFGVSPNEINYPLKFTNAGTITFKAYTSTNVNIKFRLEKNAFPNEIRTQDLTSDPSETYNGLTGDIYETNEITISPGTTSYSVTIPAQGDKEFRNVMLYVVTQDVPVTINGVTINNDTASNNMSFNQDIRTWDPPTDVALDYMFTSSSAMISEFTGFTGFGDTPTIDFFKMPYKPTSYDNLLGALNLWYQKANDPNDADALNTANNYVGTGNGSDYNSSPNTWDVTLVTQMGSLFRYITNIKTYTVHPEINGWDVSNVTAMDSMFYQVSFNQDISQWNVSNVTDMSSMFREASSFNQDISQWNVSKVTTMRNLFNDASSFNQPIGNWERTDSTLGNVEDMGFMLRGASSFNHPIGNWNVSSVTYMKSLLNKASAFSHDISGWERTGSTLGNVEDMSYMFFENSSFNQPIGNWNVSSVTNMYAMFADAYAFNQDISQWNVSNVTNMGYMFENATIFNQDISSWNVRNVTNMYAMFMNAYSFNQYIGRWNVGKVDDMREMFSGSITFQKTFGGAEKVFATGITTYKLSTGAESWGGFAVTIQELNLPLKFTNDGMITFNGYTSTDVNIKFRLEKELYVESSGDPKQSDDVSYETSEITISPGTTSYSVTIPAQGDKEFRNVMLYVVTQDVPVTINGVTINNDTPSNNMSFNQDIRTWDPPTDVALDYMFNSSSAMISKFTGFTGFGETPTIDFFNITPPAFTTDAPTIATQGQLYNYTVLTTNTLIVEATTKPDWLSFNQETNVLSGTPTNSDVGSHNIELTASAGSLNTTQSFTIEVENVNDVPTFTSDAPTSATEGQLYSYTVTTDDIDGDVVTVIATTKPDWLSFNQETNVLFGTPGQGNVGSHVVILTASDGTLSTTQSFTIVVANVNDAPTFTSDAPTSVITKQQYSYNPIATDIDGDVVTVTATTKPDWLSFDGTTLIGTPSIDDVGSHSVVLRASDGFGGTTTQVFIITVINANNPPTFTSDEKTNATQGKQYNYVVTTNDLDGDVVTVTATTKPTWLSFTNNILSGIPTISDIGSHDVVLTASDGALTATQAFTIVVIENYPPKFTSTPLRNARQELLYSYKVTTSDPDGDSVVVTATQIPSWLSFDQDTNVLSGTPTRGIWGQYRIILTATEESLDGSGALSATQEFTIMVKNPICFRAGTGILCLKNGKEQYVRVGRLMEGDLVKTLNHGYKKIVDIRKGNFKLNGLMDMGMYRMKKQGNMTADLEMTGLHCVLVDKNDEKYADDIKRQGGLKNKKFFIDGKFRLRARESHEFQQMEPGTYTIFSFTLEDEEQEQYGIWANGALVETTSRKMLEISNMIKIGQLVEEKQK